MTPLRLSIIAGASVLALIVPCVVAGHPKVATSVQASDLLISMPQPEYPLEARKKLMIGRGVYQVIFRPETGVVTRVTVLESTRWKILDDAAVKALSRWRARPGRLSRMHVPIRFTLRF